MTIFMFRQSFKNNPKLEFNEIFASCMKSILRLSKSFINLCLLKFEKSRLA